VPDPLRVFVDGSHEERRALIERLGQFPHLVVVSDPALADVVVLTPETWGEGRSGRMPRVRAIERPIEALTDREREVLALVADGLHNREIATRLGVTEHTVKFHLGAIFGKLGASTRTEAVQKGLRLGLIDI
jgi:DNA-binding CsgD family transcriptional regulator